MKTKTAFVVILTLLFEIQAFSALSRTVSSKEALTVARHFLSNQKNSASYVVHEGTAIECHGNLLAFAFDLEPTGYLIVSAETELPPVIAYSFESGFGELNTENPLYSLIINDLNKKITKIDALGQGWATKNESAWNVILAGDPGKAGEPLFEQWPASGDGWLKTNWTQDSPYNELCPLDPVTGTRSYAGCPATAMAQILNFHGTTNGTHFSDEDDYYHNYAGRQYWIDDDHDYADFPSFPVLNEYLDTLSNHYLYNQPLTNTDKAALTYACGVAARQVYSSQGSGTFGVIQAYNSYVRFGCSTVELLDSTAADLYERIQSNIKDTLPVHLAIVDESWSTGHNVVMDGYNTDDYYHLNFGWGGAYNGWYLVPEGIPYELTVIEGVVVDILKNTTTGEPEHTLTGSIVSISPNPVCKTATINFSLESPALVSFNLYSITGIPFIEYQESYPAGKGQAFSIDMSGFPAGFYSFSLRSGLNIFSGKLIKVQ
jgi:hypothetical protein